MRSGLLLFLVLAACAQADESPDVVLIVVDDLNDWVGFMKGHPQSLTPNMDALAERGIQFTNAHCNAAQCFPSRQSFLTGTYPKTTGIYFNNKKRPSFFGSQPMSGKTSNASHEAIYLHRHFLNNNYRIVSGGKITNYKKPDPDLDSYLPLQHTKENEDTYSDDRVSLWGDGGPQNLSDEETGDYRVAQWAIKEWNTPSDKPLFMTAGFYRPHRPQNVPKKYFDTFPVETTQLPLLPEGDDWDDMPPYAIGLARAHAHKEGELSDHETILKMGGEDEWKYMVSAYLACVNYVDAQIGLLLDALESNPRNRETIILLTSDHGWNLGEKKHWAKAALWNNTTHVPFVVVAPGVTKAGTMNHQPISLVDIYPTLSELADLPTPNHLEGESIVPLIQEPQRKRAYAFLSYGPENTAVQTETLRYIRYEDGSEELYDHRSDPHEWTNLADEEEYESVKQELEMKVKQFQTE
jgi:arylsulfatase A-like enzyme